MNSAINIDTITVPGGVSAEFDGKGVAVFPNIAFHERPTSIGVSLSEILRAEVLAYKISRHLTMKDIILRMRYNPPKNGK